jgi:hypothetical protein
MPEVPNVGFKIFFAEEGKKGRNNLFSGCPLQKTLY